MLQLDFSNELYADCYGRLKIVRIPVHVDG